MHRQHDYLFNATWKRSLASDNSACLTFVSFFSLESPAWMTAIIVTVIVFVALIFLSVCLAKRIRRRNREAAERFPMAIVSPPSGQSYPWQQSTPAEESVTHEN